MELRQCPKCRTRMEGLEIEGLHLELCPSCGGVWFDSDELFYHLRTKAGIKRPSAMACPRCRHAMDELKLDLGEETLLIEHCANCQGLWTSREDFEKAQRSEGAEGEGRTRIEHVLARFDRAKETRDRSPEARKRSLVLASVLTLFVLFAAGMYALSRKVQLDPYAPPVAANICKVCNGTGKVLNICAVCNGTGLAAWAREAKRGEKISCPDCGGTGHLRAGARVTCPKCGGAGFYYTPERTCEACDGTGRALVVEHKICEVCGGTGQIVKRQTCPVCHGTGRSPTHPDWSCPKCAGAKYIEVREPCPYCENGTVAIKVSKICAICGGDGRLPAERVRCPECRGKGTVETPKSGECPRCHGTGLLDPKTDGKCQTCGGKGNFGYIRCPACKGKGTIT